MAYSGSAADRLTAVQAAIANCLTSQSFTVRGRTQQMAQLKELRAMEKDLERQVNQPANMLGGLAVGTRPS